MFLDKLKKDVVKWCDDKFLTQEELSEKMKRNKKYVTLILNGHHAVNDKFWNRLEAATGIKKGDYCE